ncbi:gp49 domain protein [Acinetobacter baumannii 573719]|nr:gp49 domain protein [Acinetobacter baumannii 573719]
MKNKLLALSLCAYIGTKSVLAATMTRGEYNDYRGWQIPENEDQTEQGYLVEYVDGGKPNDDRHNGYISWSPRDVFEKSYHQSQTPQDRVRLEQIELTNKLDALENFLDKGQPNFINDEQWALLQEQQKHMDAYSDVLAKRIALF